MSVDGEPLREEAVAPDPFVQFELWFASAGAVVADPEAMALATAGERGGPSVRMVLLRSFGPEGFVFHTNYASRKGDELAANAKAALLFHWAPLGRQVRIEGRAERLPEADSDAYFATRPRGAQIAAWSSWQSRPIGGRRDLDARVAERREQYEGRPVPRPPWWGGIRIVPESFEFWQGREDRLHDRLRYSPQHKGWRIERLQP